jgi:hypothetical protein
MVLRWTFVLWISLCHLNSHVSIQAPNILTAKWHVCWNATNGTEISEKWRFLSLILVYTVTQPWKMGVRWEFRYYHDLAQGETGRREKYWAHRGFTRTHRGWRLRTWVAECGLYLLSKVPQKVSSNPVWLFPHPMPLALGTCRTWGRRRSLGSTRWGVGCNGSIHYDRTS